MGNCLKTPTADDISLLRGSDSPTEGNDSSSLGPPPPYQVGDLCLQNFWSRNSLLLLCRLIKPSWFNVQCMPNFHFYNTRLYLAAERSMKIEKYLANQGWNFDSWISKVLENFTHACGSIWRQGLCVSATLYKESEDRVHWNICWSW